MTPDPQKRKRKCAVKGCVNNSRENPNLTFHKNSNPPTDRHSVSVYVSDYFDNQVKVDQLSAWLHVLKINRLNKGMRVCSAHFKKKDYSFPDVQYSGKKPLLTRDAVPSLNLPVVDQAKDGRDKERLRRRMKREAFKSKVNMQQSSSDHSYSLSSNNEVPTDESIPAQGVRMAFGNENDCSRMEFSDTNSGDEETFQDTNWASDHDGSGECADGLHSLNVCDINNVSGNNQECVTLSDSGVFAEQSFDYVNDSISSSTPQIDDFSTAHAVISSCVSSGNFYKSHHGLELSSSFTEGIGTTVGSVGSAGKTKPTTQQRDFSVQANYKFTVLDMLKTDQQLSSATGIESFKLLDVIVNCMKTATDDHFEKKSYVMDTRKRVLMTYMKIKQNISFRFLSIIFGSIVTEQQFGRIFVQTVLMLNKIMKAIALPWPSRLTIRENLPQCFQGFENTRIVLDCTEIFIQKPQNLCCRIQVYSNYKGGDTIKFMTGVSPGGNMTFISKPYGGRYSDSAIFEQSGLVELLEPGDGVMVDKGFLIDEMCEMHRLCLIRPPFLTKKNNRKFSAKESILTASIAKARVHVERFNQRIKVFDMLGGVYPISLLPIIGEVFNLVCGTVNLSSPIIDDEKFMKSAD
ncbi:hypothetical protein QAD02_015510 [Eretmocerus hayati]|uniref:Uncharacterized protein n=1 Tax=Eretmocerus hayati TaxID=131215 RepID=A0ACC2P9F5_9HYME|nr:hypothetical protein QAD02_015510 [Eretmocerus hayati]